MPDIDTGWIDPSADPSEFVDFFVRNTSPDYISHGEILCGRAIDPGRWSPRLAEVLDTEFRQFRLPAPRAEAAGEALFVARAAPQGGLIAYAAVSFEATRAGRHVWIDDFIVDAHDRGQGVGTAFMKRLLTALQALEGIQHLFLESARRNPRAQAFFRRFGFDQTSVVMARSLRGRFDTGA